MSTPHSLQAERIILGALMIDPFSIADVKGLEPADFYRDDHGRIFKLILHLADEGQPHDMIAVVERIQQGPRSNNGVERPTRRGRPTDEDHWSLYGGIAYVSGLSDEVPSTQNLGYYVKQVREYSEARTIIHGATQLSQDLTRGYTSPSEAREKLLDLACGEGITEQSMMIGAVVEHVDQDIDAELAGNRHVFAPTGIVSLDTAHDFGGLTTQGMTLIIGASGMGKTSLLNRLALGMSAMGQKVYLYGTETDARRRTRDLQFSLAAVDQRRWASSVQRLVIARSQGRRIERLEDWVSETRHRLKLASYWLSQMPIIVNNTGRSVDQVSREIRQYHRQGRLDIAFLDYLQDFGRSPEVAPDPSSQSMHASQTLKQLSAQLNIPVVVGCQRTGEQELNSDLAKATDRSLPGLIGRLVPNQVQWTSKAKQDAEEVFSLYRRDYYADLYPDIAHALPGSEGAIEIVARKRRAGPLNRWAVDFHGPTKWVGQRPSMFSLTEAVAAR